jgi:hypothetical protein
MKSITTAGNTVAPAILALEALGFRVQIKREPEGEGCHATRKDEAYFAADPIEVLGLVKLVEVRGWLWATTDDELEEVARRHALL